MAENVKKSLKVLKKRLKVVKLANLKITAVGNSSRTAISPSHFDFKSFEPNGKIHGFGLRQAFSAEKWINLLTPISRAIRAIRLAPSTCTSLKGKFFVSNSLPIKLITTFEYFTAFLIDVSSLKWNGCNSTWPKSPHSFKLNTSDSSPRYGKMT